MGEDFVTKMLHDNSKKMYEVLIDCHRFLLWSDNFWNSDSVSCRNAVSYAAKLNRAIMECVGPIQACIQLEEERRIQEEEERREGTG